VTYRSIADLTFCPSGTQLAVVVTEQSAGALQSHLSRLFAELPEAASADQFESLLPWNITTFGSPDRSRLLRGRRTYENREIRFRRFGTKF
jgi:hypothetical protein